MNIPQKNRDLRRYVRRKRIVCLVLYGAWLALWLLGALAYNQNHQTYPPERRMEGWRMLVWMLIGAAVGFVLFRVWRLFTLRAVRGRVLSAGLSHTYTHSSDPGAGSAMEYDFRLRNALVLQLPNGKKKRLRFEQKTGSYQYYKEGAELIRYTGLPYPINTDPTAPAGFACAACGRIHAEWSDACLECGLSLIDPRDV